MTKQTPGSLFIVAAIGGGIGFVAFVALMVVGGLSFSPALFFAILVAIAALAVIFFGFHPREDGPIGSQPGGLRPSETGRLGDVTRKPGGLGLTPGSAGVKPGTAGVATGAGILSDTVPGGRASHGKMRPDSTGDMAGSAPRAATGGMPDPASGGVGSREDEHGSAPRGSERTDTSPGTDGLEAGGDRSRDETSARGMSGPEATAHPATEPTEGTPNSGGFDKTAAEPRSGAATTTPGPTSAGGDLGDGPATTTTTSGAADAGAAGRASGAPVSTDDATTSGTGPNAAPVDAGPSRPAASNETDTSGDAGRKNASDEVAEGTPPERLDSPRGGNADDLQQIKGVGPKLEELLNGLGIYHFDQIAGWTDDELLWIDGHIEGFRGRASRDDWRGQAKALSQAGS